MESKSSKEMCEWYAHHHECMQKKMAYLSPQTTLFPCIIQINRKDKEPSLPTGRGNKQTEEKQGKDKQTFVDLLPCPVTCGFWHRWLRGESGAQTECYMLRVDCALGWRLQTWFVPACKDAFQHLWLFVRQFMAALKRALQKTHLLYANLVLCNSCVCILLPFTSLQNPHFFIGAEHLTHLPWESCTNQFKCLDGKPMPIYPHPTSGK